VTRIVRVFLLATMAAWALGGCGSGAGASGAAGRGGGPAGGAGASGGHGGAASAGTSPPKADILFMVGNSASMGPLQQKMAAQLPAFI